MFAAVTIAALLLTCAPLFAHHGFAGRYDEDNPITVTGTVVELQFQNPHSFIIFESEGYRRQDPALASRAGLRERDWPGKAGTRTTLKAGDKITIIGPQNKNGSGD